MHFVTTSAAVLCLLAGAAAAIHTPETVFLDKEQATSLISRQKRNAPSTLEQACMEKVCTYEEARKFFQDSYRTDIFWSVYIDGDQCAEKPCKNGAMCSDSVGGYDCVCKSGFSGVHCERDETLCTLEKDKGCSQFCKPGYVAYKCSCAHGWKLSTDREKCIPAETPHLGNATGDILVRCLNHFNCLLLIWRSSGSTLSLSRMTGLLTLSLKENPATLPRKQCGSYSFSHYSELMTIGEVQFPCGKVSYPQSWQDRLSRSSTSNSVGFPCMALDCPWLALLVSSESAVFCSGVILKENLVLTTAQCASKYSSFQVAVGKRSTSSSDAGQQTLYVKLTHTHPRYVEGRPENDLAVIELRDRIIFKREVTAACLPERDFAESILMAGEHPAVVTGWKEPQQRSAFQDVLALNTLVYNKLPECLETHPNLMTNKMGCTAPREKADCTMSSGSTLLTLYRDVFFLTGVVSHPAGADCSKGYIFQKVSRYLGWLQQRMGSR